MIFSIQGLTETILEDSIVVSLGGFVSFQVMTPKAEHFISGQMVKLFTHLQVREDAFVLYGFRTEEDLWWFRILLSIPGIGSKTALNILSTFSLEELSSIIWEEKHQLLTKASGVGSATAKKIVLFLGEKLKKKQLKPPKKDCPFPEAFEEAKHILTDLGLTQKEATELLLEIKKEDGTLCEEPQTLVKEALKRRNL
jgi:Holliday junction DNA helicase RuvA